MGVVPRIGHRADDDDASDPDFASKLLVKGDFDVQRLDVLAAHPDGAASADLKAALNRTPPTSSHRPWRDRHEEVLPASVLVRR
jgi:hypothetical protein